MSQNDTLLTQNLHIFANLSDLNLVAYCNTPRKTAWINQF